MNTLNITIPVEVRHFEELTEADRELVMAAKDATNGSYAPYSNFHVGAAILLDNNIIVKGANQENAAFSSGTCGERSACFNAAANYPQNEMNAIAIAACNNEGFQRKPISPCGPCRQALLEYEHKQGHPIRVILYGADECYILPSIASLLPLCFTEF